MLISKSYWRDRSFPLFATDGAGGGAGGAGKDEAKADTDDATEGLSDNDRDALKRLGEQRDAARKERDALRREKAEREAEDAKAKDQAEADAGQFEGLAKKRGAELDAARKEAMSLKADNDQLSEAITTMLDAEWPQLSPEALEYFAGDEEKPLDRLAFLPKGRKLTAKLAEKADPARGNGQDPRSRGAGNANKATEEEARRANASRYE